MTNSTEKTEQSILAELTPIFRSIFENDTLVVTPELTAKDVDGWDSLTHMSLIVAVEEHFKIKFKLRDVVKFRNLGDMCATVLASLKSRA
ncbi:acyl carrier protein [Duganella vulcania]|uniref:Acyl carrier protein n=1 Tax=Duganella vulcania TaxID=2692166 RepID=A0A845GZV8_9BURK|nr:acyl carrier protein [Duganella vulcania]MYM97999.1 acyl carrier protein [Duganella vulcania]